LDIDDIKTIKLIAGDIKKWRILKPMGFLIKETGYLYLVYVKYPIDRYVDRKLKELEKRE